MSKALAAHYGRYTNRQLHFAYGAQVARSLDQAPGGTADRAVAVIRREWRRRQLDLGLLDDAWTEPGEASPECLAAGSYRFPGADVQQVADLISDAIVSTGDGSTPVVLVCQVYRAAP